MNSSNNSGSNLCSLSDVKRARNTQTDICKTFVPYKMPAEQLQKTFLSKREHTNGTNKDKTEGKLEILTLNLLTSKLFELNETNLEDRSRDMHNYEISD